MKSRCKLFFLRCSLWRLQSLYVVPNMLLIAWTHASSHAGLCSHAGFIYSSKLRDKKQPFDVASIVSKYQPFTTSVFVVVVGSLLGT